MRIGTMTRRLMAAGVLSCVGLTPLSASALMLGEIVAHSYLGQIFRATIPLNPDAGEELDRRCLVLARPARQDDGAYLSQAYLSLEQKNGQAHLAIRSVNAVNEPFVRLLVRADCGQGRSEREFVVLLDPEERAPLQPPVLARDTTVEPRLEAPPAPVRKPRRVRAAPFTHKPRAVADLPRQAAPAPDVSGGRASVAESPVPVRPAGAGEFRLKLSSAELDLSKLGKLSEEQRRQLREKQRLLDADDQVANTLSMKNRIMQLESQLDELQAELGKTNSRLGTQLASRPLPVAPPVQQAGERKRESGEAISFRGMVAAGLTLALAALAWWRWRRRRTEAWLDKELNQEFPANVADRKPLAPPGEKPVTVAPPAPVTVPATAPAKVEDDFYHDVTSIFDNDSESVTFTEAESVLDEADLYLAYGWANRAIELLQGYIEKHPDDAQLWKKLFEMYCSQGMKQEFEQLALRCQTTMDDSSLWVLVQKLGRQLDEGNPLYSSSPEQQAVVTEEAPQPAASQEKRLELDKPLEFVLEEKAAETATEEPAAKEESLDFEPLFPEGDGKTEKGA